MELTERNDIDEVLRIYHKSLLGAHNGINKMTQTINKFFTWKNQTNDIKEYVKNCPICEKTKVIKHTKVPMVITSIGEQAFDCTHVEFYGPLKETVNGMKYVLGFCCNLTKYCLFIATSDCTALTVANCLLEHVICHFNFPSCLISDNATSFTSNVIKELTNLLRIKKIFSTPYRPEANAQIERQNRSLG